MYPHVSFHTPTHLQTRMVPVSVNLGCGEGTTSSPLYRGRRLSTVL